MTHNYTMIVVFFTIAGAFGGGGMLRIYPAYLAERFPTEVRATASRFCLSSGRDLRRLDRTDHHLFRGQLAFGLCDPDGSRHDAGLPQRRRRGFGRARDTRQGAAGGIVGRLTPSKSPDARDGVELVSATGRRTTRR